MNGLERSLVQRAWWSSFFLTIANLVQGPSVKAMDSSVSQGRHLDQELLAESTPVLEGGCF